MSLRLTQNKVIWTMLCFVCGKYLILFECPPLAVIWLQFFPKVKYSSQLCWVLHPSQERIPVIHKQQEEVLTLWCVSLKIWSSLDHLMMQFIGHTTGTGSGGDLMNHQDPVQLMFDSYFVVFQHIISLLSSFTHPHVVPNPTWRNGITSRMFTHLFSIWTTFKVFSRHTTLVMLPSKVAYLQSINKNRSCCNRGSSPGPTGSHESQIWVCRSVFEIAKGQHF